MVKLDIYHALAFVIPGLTLYGVILKLFPEANLEFEPLTAIAISFFIGYFINSLSSILERFFFALWGGKPSSQLLDGKFMGKIKLYEWEVIKEQLISEARNPSPSNDELFAIALRKATQSENNRIEAFNSIYAFSRVILMTIIIIGVLVAIKTSIGWWGYLLILLLIFLTGFRSKQRGYYFAKEVLQVYAHTSPAKQDYE